MNEQPSADPFSGFSAASLRERYAPRRLARPLLALVPWADVLLLVLAFAFFGQAAALVPGELVDLPEAEFRAGAASTLVLVVRALPGSPDAAGADAGAPLADAFFADERFPLARPERAAALREAVAAASAAAGEDTAVVYMDGSLPHRDALRVCALLREAGLRHVLFAARPPAPPAP